MGKRIVIIGGGPGGYVAAIRAAQFGAEVHIAEAGRIGGTCLNVGCIPTKALLHAASFYKSIKTGAVAGVKAENVSLDWSAVQKQKKTVTDRLINGVGHLLAANRIIIHKGEASFTGFKTAAVNGEALPDADAIIIASGSVPLKPNFPGADIPRVLDSDAALALTDVPMSICIVGGGVVGVEFASIFSSAGSKVNIIEMLPEILPQTDAQVAATMRKILEKSGIEIFTDAKLAAVKKAEDGRLISAIARKDEKKHMHIESEFVLTAAGRKANIEGLALDKTGIETDKGAITVDENFETNVKGVFAVGDCNAKCMLAHAASAQGEAAVEYIFKGRHSYNADLIPYCIYTAPEAAGIGLTEEQTRRKGFDCTIGLFDLGTNGKALIEGGAGFIKIIADKESGEIIGAHMIGPHVTDMVAEFAVTMSMEGLVDDIARVVHAHPTVSEALREAAMAAFGNAIHRPPTHS
jgi:dihydrolipoamide dehydrogenase